MVSPNDPSTPATASMTDGGTDFAAVSKNLSSFCSGISRTFPRPRFQLANDDHRCAVPERLLELEPEPTHRLTAGTGALY